MTLTLYGAALSPYVRAVRATFAEKGVEYQFESIGPADLQKPDYAKRHPFRKLPALDVNGQALYETSAILRFIDEAHEGIQLQPTDPLAKARCEQWMSVAKSYLYPDLFTGLFFPRALAPQFGMPVDEALIAVSTEKTRGHLAVIAEALTEGTLGAEDQITLGDILVAAILMPLEQIDEGHELLAAVPAMAGWVGGFSRRSSFAGAS
ncbi:MAG: glutathione S-transferase family protein [Pseudomonadota bacterium]